MLKRRLIANLVIKDNLIVQSFGFNRYLPIGKPRFTLEFLARWDVDEIIISDISASKENRLFNTDILEYISKYCFVPITVGGGIKSLSDAKKIIRSGADKISINKSAIKNNTLIRKISNYFGKQCVVVSIDYKLTKNGFRVYDYSKSKVLNYNPVEWAKKMEENGAGEIFLNSVDRDGMRSGYDIDLIESVVNSVKIPVICCGGAGSFAHFLAPFSKTKVSAVAAANFFHHTEHSTILTKAHMARNNINVRISEEANYLTKSFDKDGRLIVENFNNPYF